MWPCTTDVFGRGAYKRQGRIVSLGLQLSFSVESYTQVAVENCDCIRKFMQSFGSICPNAAENHAKTFQEQFKFQYVLAWDKQRAVSGLVRRFIFA